MGVFSSESRSRLSLVLAGSALLRELGAWVFGEKAGLFGDNTGLFDETPELLGEKAGLLWENTGLFGDKPDSPIRDERRDTEPWSRDALRVNELESREVFRPNELESREVLRDGCSASKSTTREVRLELCSNSRDKSWEEDSRRAEDSRREEDSRRKEESRRVKELFSPGREDRRAEPPCSALEARRPDDDDVEGVNERLAE